MQRWERPDGNTAGALGVARDDVSSDVGRINPEDLTITTLTSPASMSHPERYRDAGWVEPSEEPYGTAVFDATGD
ncbi:MAG: RNA polymerase sigma factor SigE, partial [Mycobacterium sp.]